MSKSSYPLSVPPTNFPFYAPPSLLDAAVLSLGSESVLHNVFARLSACEPITIVSLGSSITARRGGCSHMLGTERRGCCGTSCATEHGWLRTWFDGLNASFPHVQHRLFNAGTLASTPRLFMECLDMFLPARVDLFVFEFVADPTDIGTLVRHMRSRAAPGEPPPAVLFANFFRWNMLNNFAKWSGTAGDSLTGDFNFDPFAAHDTLSRAAAAEQLPVVSLLHGLRAAGFGIAGPGGTGLRSANWSALQQQERDTAGRCGAGGGGASGGGGGRMLRRTGSRGKLLESTPLPPKEQPHCWCPSCQASDGTHPGPIGQRFMGEAMLTLTQRAWLRYLHSLPPAASAAQQQGCRPGRRLMQHRQERDRALSKRGGRRNAKQPTGAVLGTAATPRSADGPPAPLLQQRPRRRTAACYTFDARLTPPGSPPFLDMLASSRGPKGRSLICPKACKNDVQRARIVLGSLPPGSIQEGKIESINLEGPPLPPARLLDASGWHYVLESRSPIEPGVAMLVARPGIKPGLVATAAGATALFNLSYISAEVVAVPSTPPSTTGAVSAMRPYIAVDYLTSYEHMGVVELRCVHGCSCEPQTIDAHAPAERASIRKVAYVHVSRLEGCALRLTVLEQTGSGGHKFKLVRLSTGFK